MQSQYRALHYRASRGKKYKQTTSRRLQHSPNLFFFLRPDFMILCFFAERIINTWNSLPHDSIDFSSLRAFQRGIEENDFSRFLCLC